MFLKKRGKNLYDFFVPSSRKAQGLSINTIIVAALALIVLVVLVLIFTGKIGTWSAGVDKEGKADLAVLRIQYGNCHPSSGAETVFTNTFSAAESPEDEERAKSDFKDVITLCKQNVDKASCEGAGQCSWK